MHALPPAGTHSARRRRALQSVILPTALLLMLVVAGWHMLEHEESRVRPEYFGEGNFKYNGQRLNPAAQLRGVAVFAAGFFSISALWLITFARVLPIIVLPAWTVRRKRSRKTPSPSLLVAGKLGIIAHLLCPAFHLAFAVIVLLGVIWDVFHYFRQEDNQSYRGTSLWWAEEAGGLALLCQLLVIPSCILLACGCIVAGFRVRKHLTAVASGIGKPRFASLCIIIGTLLLVSSFALYIAASLQLFPAIDRAPWQRPYSAYSQLHTDGLRIERLYLASCYPAILGSWLILAGAIYDGLLIQLLALHPPSGVAAPLQKKLSTTTVP